MKYKTNTELRAIHDLKKTPKEDKEKAKDVLESREGKNFDELNYELNLHQTKKISEIHGMVIFFVVIIVLSLLASIYFITEISK